MRKKVLALLLAMAMVVSLAACGSSSSSSGSSGSSGEKPETITVMVDGTVFTEANGRAEFWDKCEELTGIHYEVTQPDHDAYYDVVGQTIATGDWPDVIILSSTYYVSYANEGVLWDMTEAYENSSLKERIDAAGSSSVVEGMYIDGHLYGMPVTRGNGCITYVKQAWLDACGLEAPTTYDEYIAMLEAFSTGDPDGDGINGNTYGVSASGFIGSDSPYVNYLPEFYQDAWPSFYQQDDGTWADGFTEDSMKEALQRIADAYAEGLIDPTTLTNGTKDCRTKYYSNEFGVFTYWAGTWSTNLTSNLVNNGVDGELVALEPIAEVPYYYDRIPVPWCITTQCENPEGVFEYFISAMLDGGDVELLFTYGVEGVHWSTEAETLYEGADNEVTYEEGEFHMLDNLETPGTQYTKAHIDPMLALVPITDDPGADTIAEGARTAQEMFNANCQTVTLVPATDEYSDYNGALVSEKNELIAKVAIGEMTVEEAYEEYAKEAQAWSDLIVESLNAN
ncbi:MAG: extracellular solute-binding protein [Lachnospiraceae bacterium]|nr:extracellular solute-binding protein [Lachnospiraceae bacterium]